MAFPATGRITTALSIIAILPTIVFGILSTIAFGAVLYVGGPAEAQAQAGALRTIPARALTGTLEPKNFPEALLDGRPVRLTAGARIHDRDNRIVMPASLAGARLRVLYTTDISGAIDRVWLPSDVELAAAAARRR